MDEVKEYEKKEKTFFNTLAAAVELPPLLSLASWSCPRCRRCHRGVVLDAAVELSPAAVAAVVELPPLLPWSCPPLLSLPSRSCPRCCRFLCLLSTNFNFTIMNYILNYSIIFSIRVKHKSKKWSCIVVPNHLPTFVSVRARRHGQPCARVHQTAVVTVEAATTSLTTGSPMLLGLTTILMPKINFFLSRCHEIFGLSLFVFTSIVLIDEK